MSKVFTNIIIICYKITTFAPLNSKIPNYTMISKSDKRQIGYDTKCSHPHMTSSNNDVTSYIMPRMRLAIGIAAAFAAVMLAACSEGKGGYSFGSSEEALSESRIFLERLRRQDNVSVKALAQSVNEWMEMNDSVKACVLRDTTNQAHMYPVIEYASLLDSINEEFARLAVSKRRNYRDLVEFRAITACRDSKSPIMEIAAKARPFFSSLDSIPVNVSGGKRQVKERYIGFLDKSLQKGFHNGDDLFRFLQKEESHFRAFLHFLPDMVDEDLMDITGKTEKCCRTIAKAARLGKLPKKDTDVYLTMRTNHRLLLNTEVALENLKNGKVDKEASLHAYMFLLLNPFVFIDDDAFALLSDEERAKLYKIADAAPRELQRMAKKLHMNKDKMADIPGDMLQVYVGKKITLMAN